LHDAELKLEEAEQYSRRDNLVISGIPAILSEVASATGTQEIEYSSTSVNKVIAFCKDDLQVDVESSELSTDFALVVTPLILLC
jgi:hypothetical protein